VIDAYTLPRLPPHKKKSTPPTDDAVTVLGVEMDGHNGVISLSAVKHSALVHATVALLHQPLVSGKQLSAVVGSWTWPMLLRRPLLAVFKHVYRFATKFPDQDHPLWPSARRELLTVIALAPLMRCNLRRPDWPQLLATDASMHGAGVVSTRLTSSLRSALWPVMTHSDCDLLSELQAVPVPGALLEQLTWPALSAAQPVMEHRGATVNAALVRQTACDLIASCTWSTIISCPWRRSQHINELELQSMILCVRWALSCPGVAHSQLLLLADSTAAHYGVGKGRSRSPHLLTLLRRFSAYILAGDVTVLTGWVPSALNPADSPSRKYRDTLPMAT